jgi:hypothetical protein
VPAAAWLLMEHGRATAPAGGADERPGPVAWLRSRRALRVALALGVPILAAAALHAAYNFARFGNPLDAGYRSTFMNTRFQALVAHYGLFNLQFLPHNLTGWFLVPPRFVNGALLPNPRGMSLLLTTPFLLLLLARRRPRPLEWVLLANSALIAVPALLYYNDGWVQFGQRFALDWIALALGAATLATRRVPAWLVATLTAIGIAVNTWGMLWFQANVPH